MSWAMLTVAGIAAVDAAVGLPLGLRSVLRWLLAAAILVYWAGLIRRKLSSLTLRRVIADVEIKLGFRHDPLANAWSFLAERRSAGGEFVQELIARQIEQARLLLTQQEGEVRSLFGLADLFMNLWPRTLLRLAACPLVFIGLGLGAHVDPRLLALRVIDPYREMAGVIKNIELDPAPGVYEKLSGPAVSVRLHIHGARPVHWKTPVMSVEGEESDMTLTETRAGNESYIYTLPTLQERVKLDLRWGEFRAGPWVFEPVVAAAVTRLKIQIEPPLYAQGPASAAENPTYLSAVKGSRFQARVESDQALRDVEIFLEREGRRPLRLAQIAARGKKIVEFAILPQEAGRFRVALRDQRGLVNPQGWIFMLDLMDDAVPSASILEPAFGEVQMDADETLAVAWEAADDLGLESVQSVFEGAVPPLPASRRFLWQAPGKAAVTQKRDHFTFRPKLWGMKANDQALLYLEAKDYRPGSIISKSQALLIKIQDFRARHQENLDKKNHDIRQELLSHVEKGLELDSEMANVSSSTYRGVNEELARYDEESSRLAGKLGEFAGRLEKDPLADPKWSRGLARLARSARQARAQYLAPARAALSAHETQGARQELKRYLEEMEKGASSVGELGKEQKMDEAVSAASRLEEMVEQLKRNLENAQDAQELDSLMKDINRELQGLAQSLSKMTPEEFPQDFVNQMPTEDATVAQLGNARAELQEALKRGDAKAALEAAQRMLEGIKKLRSDLDEAAQAHGAKQKSRAGQLSEGGEGQEGGSLAKEISDIRAGQERLLWKTSQMDRALEAFDPAAAPKDKDTASLRELSREQKALAGQSRQTLEKLSELDREDPALALGSKVMSLEAAWKEQISASQALADPRLPAALEAQSSALKRLEELEDELKEMEREMSSESGAGGLGRGRRRSIIFAPGAGRGWGESQGLRLGEVAIPKPEDYKVPSRGREEILRSLREKRPSELEREVGEYLRNLLK